MFVDGLTELALVSRMERAHRLLLEGNFDEGIPLMRAVMNDTTIMLKILEGPANRMKADAP